MNVKTFVSALAVVVSLALGAGSAWAFSCPTLIKAANEAIVQAETNVASITGDREKARATGMLEEAKELSKAAEAAHPGSHARSEAKAKAARFLAEQVK